MAKDYDFTLRKADIRNLDEWEWRHTWDDTVPVGTDWYLIERQFLMNAPAVSARPYLFDACPGRTNMSHEARSRGWLGATDNVSYTALGRVRIVSETSTTIRLRQLSDWPEGEEVE